MRAFALWDLDRNCIARDPTSTRYGGSGALAVYETQEMAERAKPLAELQVHRVKVVPLLNFDRSARWAAEGRCPECGSRVVGC